MANNYFQCKQFIVHQSQAAMRVCTDACLFGALLPQHPFQKALDIGTGTGLLSLMFAQKNPLASIHAVEIDAGAIADAERNFGLSPWKDRLTLFHQNIQVFSSSHVKEYDIIFSNPPFYTQDLTSCNEQRNIALHCSELSWGDLLQSVRVCLSEKGIFCVLIPYQRIADFITIATSLYLFPFKIYHIKQTIHHSFFRSILFFSAANSKIITEELCIKDEDGDYTNEFNRLLQPYYLHL